MATLRHTRAAWTFMCDSLGSFTRINEDDDLYLELFLRKMTRHLVEGHLPVYSDVYISKIAPEFYSE